MTERSNKIDPEPSEWDNIQIPKKNFLNEGDKCHLEKIDGIFNDTINDHFEEIKDQMEKINPEIKLKLEKELLINPEKIKVNFLKVQNGPEKEKQEGLPAEVSNSDQKKKKFSFLIINSLTECEVCQYGFEKIKTKINCSECPYY